VVHSAIADRELAAPPAREMAAAGDLLELFGLVTDGRPGQGRDHPVAAVLALAAAAVVGRDEGIHRDRRLGEGCPAGGAGRFVPASRCQPGAAAIEGDNLAGDHRR
jgi:hypothetical protein